MKRAYSVILLGSLLAAAAAQATTYVRVEKDGSKTYSDRPLPGGQEVVIESAQTYSAPPAPPPRDASRSPEEQQVLDAANFSYACALTPRADETFQNPESILLSVQLTPGLRPGDQVKFSMDGANVANEDNATSSMVQFPDRGTHTAGVQVTDRSGKSLCSVSATFHVQRTGVNSPARQGPPRPPPPRPTPQPRPPKG
jgi:uncharacterized protein DUF4124